MTGDSRAHKVPAFAVVGHPNKGKSSIVATLAEDPNVAISDIPGTTRKSQPFTFRIDAEPLYTLIDTPGFQRATAVLDWLASRASQANERPSAVQAFVDTHADDERFHDEVELLRPILEGAGILYVVDGAKPYGREYEVEMQILQWTGQPRMALINRIGEGDYVEQWRQALGQHFSIVREFNALHADFDKRLSLLRAFAELDESSRSAIEAAVAAMTTERARRLRLSARTVAENLIEALGLSEQSNLAEGADTDALTTTLRDRLQERLRRCEARQRRSIEALYRHSDLAAEFSGELPGGDLFAAESWQLFGLSREQLLISGALSGAVAGTGIDVLLGGASLLLGAGIGAVVGGAGAWFGGDELAKAKVLGQPLGGQVLEVGPVQAANFPWVWLGRALLHHRLVAETNHARRQAISLSLAGAENVMDGIGAELRKTLARALAKHDSDGPRPLADAIEQLLETPAQASN